MSSNILEYYQKHKAIIEELLPLCARPDEVEAIHNLRLSVKRIRVLITLAELLSEKTLHSKVLLKPLRKLFKESGKLRDRQVTIQLLESYRNDDLMPLISTFKEKENRQRVKFAAALELFDIHCLNDYENALKGLLDNVSATKAFAEGQMLLSDLENEIIELFYSRADEKRMHDIRTRLKSINYLNNIYNGQLPVQDQLGIDAGRLSELCDMAGAWHDCLNLEIKLNKFISKNADISYAPVILDIKKSLILKKQGLFQEYSCILLNEMKI